MAKYSKTIWANVYDSLIIYQKSNLKESNDKLSEEGLEYSDDGCLMLIEALDKTQDIT